MSGRNAKLVRHYLRLAAEGLERLGRVAERMGVPLERVQNDRKRRAKRSFCRLPAALKARERRRFMRKAHPYVTVTDVWRVAAAGQPVHMGQRIT